MDSNEKTSPLQEKRGLQSSSNGRETLSPSRPVNSTSVTPPPKYYDKAPKKRPVSLGRPLTPDFFPSYLKAQPSIANKESTSPHYGISKSTRVSAFDLNVRTEENKLNVKSEPITNEGKQSFRVTVDTIELESGKTPNDNVSENKNNNNNNKDNSNSNSNNTATNENGPLSPKTRKAYGISRTSAITELNPLKLSIDRNSSIQDTGSNNNNNNVLKRSGSIINQRDILKYLKQSGDAPLKVDEVGFEKSLCIWSEAELLEFMKNGSFMLKYSKKGKSPSRIKLKLSASEDYLIIIPSSAYKKEKKIYLRIIDELRKGQKTKVFATQKGNRNKFTTHLLFQTSFSLIYGSSSAKTLNVSCNSSEDFSKWTHGLIKVINKLKQEETELQVVTREWEKQKKKDNLISFSQIETLLSVLNFSAKQTFIKDKLKEFDKDGNKKLDINGFMDLLLALRRRNEIEDLFNKYSAQKNVMTEGDLRYFFHIEQMVQRFINNNNKKETDLTLEHSRLIISLFEKKSSLGLTKPGFDKLLTSNLNNAFKPQNRIVYQDMNRPLNHYWIASSHNTYLERDQFRGRSSVEMYAQVLKQGCRCVELGIKNVCHVLMNSTDVWDGKDGEPEIFHGHTLTSRIKFEDVLKVIRDYAFVTSPYPVILSIELHCSKPQQKRMAVLYREIFGDMLALLPSSWETEAFDRSNGTLNGPGVPTALPSPEQLKGKILVKGKRRRTSFNTRGSISPVVGGLPPEQDAFSLSDFVDLKNSENQDPSASPTQLDKREREREIEVTNEKIAEELSQVNYLSGVKFKDLTANTSVPWETFSVNETKFERILEKPGNAIKFSNYNNKQLSRIYPKGSRLDSSNYNPITAWNLGCQLVALNYQTPGEAMWLNNGRFLDNGKCGYVLKPDILFQENWDPKNAESLVSTKPVTLRITVLSARMLPKGKSGDVIDPFVEVEVCGAPIDCKQAKTTIIQDNGFNPSWNQSFSFVIHADLLALLAIYVKDNKDNNRVIGHFCLPFSCLQQGFRVLTLKDDQDQQIPFCNLFCHFSILGFHFFYIKTRVVIAFGLEMKFFMSSIDGFLGNELQNCLRSEQGFEITGKTKAAKDFSEYKDSLLSSDIVIYDLFKDSLDDVRLAYQELSKQSEDSKVFICVSNVLTWAKTPVGKEDQPLAEEDFRKRKPHPNYKEHIFLEKLVLKNKNPNLKTYVICSGITYGNGEDWLHFLFKKAWNGEVLPIIGDGSNVLPTIHIHDLANVIIRVANAKPSESSYILAVDNSNITLKDIVQSISTTLGNGEVKQHTKEEALLLPEINQVIIDSLTTNLRTEPILINEIELSWSFESGIVDNIISIVDQYKQKRELTPIKVVVLGPPLSGKTTLCKELVKEYVFHHLQPPNFGEEETKQDPNLLIDNLRTKLRSWKCQNQGYILDGFPLSLAQATALFKGEENNNIVPEYIISLDASDEFLRGRALSAVESELGQSDAFSLRLAQFRENNTEEKTPLHFFEQQSALVIPLEVTSSLSTMIEKARSVIGKPHIYGLSIAEIERNKIFEENEVLRKIKEQEENKLAEEEEKRKKEQQSMEWAIRIAKLEKEEKEMLDIQSAPFRTYLMEQIMPTVAEGLVKLLTEGSGDPIQYLAQYLFKKCEE